MRVRNGIGAEQIGNKGVADGTQQDLSPERSPPRTQISGRQEKHVGVAGRRAALGCTTLLAAAGSMQALMPCRPLLPRAVPPAPAGFQLAAWGTVRAEGTPGAAAGCQPAACATGRAGAAPAAAG